MCRIHLLRLAAKGNGVFGAFAMALDVLVLDDNEQDIRAIRSATTGGVVDVHFTSTCDDALAYLHQRGRYSHARRPNLVLLDDSTCDFHGFDVLEDLKADRGLRSIPVVVLTDHGGDLLPSYDGGRCLILMKPLTVGRARELLTEFSH